MLTEGEIKQHPKNTATCRAGGDADEIGTDERITQHALQRRTGDAQTNASHCGDQDTWQTYDLHYDLFFQ